ncbi:MAG: HlyD family efflux transporter periplasmic adaptor subunit [Rhodospirillaceae bacterium]|nr:HlyD family efflux transporter periplasmic adaptor subunit [Rhodospirillaceae bacterium]MBT5659463.1 HlyD family efflux transporter periplasmic adaptor subunit [Rhodospirillaceae bacterium]MBT7944221.1 HlyD family efflux transporter periplasmic adaptor subunit [Alphaproteobacteria bacterium]
MTQGGKRRKPGGKKDLAKRWRSLQQAKVGLLLVFVLAILGYVFFAWPFSVVVTNVSYGPVVETVFARGIVEPNLFDVPAPADGKVTGIAVSEGMPVAEGGILATLDNPAHPYVTAPLSGRVYRLDAIKDDKVTAGKSVMLLEVCCALRLAAEVSEGMLPKLVEGQKVEVTSTDFPGQIFSGVLKMIIPVTVEGEQRYRLHALLELGVPLKAGAMADMNVVIRREDNALQVPVSALKDGHIWVVEGGRAKALSVSVGVVEKGKIQIPFGLTGEEEIILAPSRQMRDGSRVVIDKRIKP